jgi:hypothetical protein
MNVSNNFIKIKKKKHCENKYTTFDFFNPPHTPTQHHSWTNHNNSKQKRSPT